MDTYSQKENQGSTVKFMFPCLLLAATVFVCLVAGLVSVFQSQPDSNIPPVNRSQTEFNPGKDERAIANVPKNCNHTTIHVSGGQFYCPANNPQDQCFLVCDTGLVPSNGTVFKCIQSRWIPPLEESGCVTAVALVVGGDTGGDNDKVEIVSLTENCDKRMPDLPRSRVWHSSVLIGGPYLRSGSAVLTCGGIEGFNYMVGEDQDIANCIELDLSRHDGEWNHHSVMFKNSGRFRHNTVEVLGKVIHMGGGDVNYIKEESTTEILDTTRPFINAHIQNYFYYIDENNINNGVGQTFSTDPLGSYIIPVIAGANISHKYYQIWRPTYNNQVVDFFPLDTDLQPQPGAWLNKPLLWSCSVRISEDSILVTGGYKSLVETWLYSINTGSSKRLANMKRGRYRHACVVIRTETEVAVLVSGGIGMVRNSDTLESSELLRIKSTAPPTWKWEEAGRLREGREGHGMVVLGGEKIQIVAIGGRGTNRERLDSLEVFKMADNKWETSGRKLKDPRWGFSVVAVPYTVCNSW